MTDVRKEHTVLIGGVEHTMLLDSDDAERLGVEARTKSAAPQNKSRATSDK